MKCIGGNEQGMTAAFKYVSGYPKEQRINLFCVTPDSRAMILKGMLWGDSFQRHVRKTFPESRASQQWPVD